MLRDLTLEKAVEFAVEVEEKGAELYEELSREYRDQPEPGEMFATLAQDEKHHSQQFAALSKLVKDDGRQPIAPDQRDYLEAMALSEFFAVNDGPFRGVDEIENRQDALAKVFAFEKATLGFYQAIEEILGENEVLGSLIDTEKQHVITVAKVMIADSKLRSLSDSW